MAAAAAGTLTRAAGLREGLRLLAAAPLGGALSRMMTTQHRPLRSGLAALASASKNKAVRDGAEAAWAALFAHLAHELALSAGCGSGVRIGGGGDEGRGSGGGPRGQAGDGPDSGGEVAAVARDALKEMLSELQRALADG
eukprot:344714-Chlamydomonas_euryale.AAC.7